MSFFAYLVAQPVAWAIGGYLFHLGLMTWVAAATPESFVNPADAEADLANRMPAAQFALDTSVSLWADVQAATEAARGARNAATLALDHDDVQAYIRAHNRVVESDELARLARLTVDDNPGNSIRVAEEIASEALGQAAQAMTQEGVIAAIDAAVRVAELEEVVAERVATYEEFSARMVGIVARAVAPRNYLDALHGAAY